MMTDEVFKPHGSRVTTSQETPTDALPNTAASVSGEQGDLPTEKAPLPEKRRLDTASEVDLLPTKRAQLSRASSPQSGSTHEATECAFLQESQLPTEDLVQEAWYEVEGQAQTSPAGSLRKRQIGGDYSDDSQPEPKRARLTRKNLAELNKMVKTSSPGLSTSRGSCKHKVAKKASNTPSHFVVRASRNGILNPRRSRPPKNLEEIRNRLGESRQSVSPPESVYEDFVDKVSGAANDATMVGQMLPLLKSYPKDNYVMALNQAFTGFPKEAGFNNGLSTPQPDYTEGLRKEEYDPFPVDDYVDGAGAVLYKDNPDSLTLPLLAGEWKRVGKDLEEARLQSAYTGAALVYARNKVLSHIGQPDSPGHAEVTTFTTDGTIMNFFAHYTSKTEYGTLQYHQYPITTALLKNSYRDFKRGRKALRNCQDYARKQSYALKDMVMNHWKHTTPVLPLVEPSGSTSAHAEEEKEEGETSSEPVEQALNSTLPQLANTQEEEIGEGETGSELVEKVHQPPPLDPSKSEPMSLPDKMPSLRHSSPPTPPPTANGTGSNTNKRKSRSQGSPGRSSRQKTTEGG